MTPDVPHPKPGDSVRLAFLGSGSGVPKECDGVWATVLWTHRDRVTVEWRRRELVERRPVPVKAITEVRGGDQDLLVASQTPASTSSDPGRNVAGSGSRSTIQESAAPSAGWA